jgi:hypothetical protein
LAAGTLQDLGLRAATDVSGYEAGTEAAYRAGCPGRRWSATPTHRWRRGSTCSRPSCSTLAIETIGDLDLSYTPPCSAPWDAVQVAAQEWVRAVATGTRAGARRAGTVLARD